MMEEKHFGCGYSSLSGTDMGNLNSKPDKCEETSNNENIKPDKESLSNEISSAAGFRDTKSLLNCTPLKEYMPGTASTSARNFPTTKPRVISHTPNFNWSRTWEEQSSPIYQPSLSFHKWPGRSSPLLTQSHESQERSTNPDLVTLRSSKIQSYSCGVQMPIAGITVEFPHEPYPVQKYMMSQLITAIKKANHCLLESPTGTGKTLALLCSTLAWQQKEEELLRELRATASCIMNDKPDEVKGKTLSNPEFAEQASSVNVIPEENVIILPDSDSDDDIFRSPKRKKTTADFKAFPTNTSDSSKTCEEGMPVQIKSHGEKEGNPNVAETPCGIESFRPPKIFYGTRTHKQITQVVDQLKKTSYGNKVKMTILASRDHTCVNNQVCNQPNVTQACQALIDPIKGLGCSYYTGSCRGSTHQTLSAYQLPPVYDIEDIVKIGRKHKLCPYFTLRNLIVKSDIVFCPYNYLIDPVIRESMNINVAKSIVIMDEAHNIEDTCREAGSLWIRQQELIEAIAECDESIKRRNSPAEYSNIKEFLVMLDDWLNNYGPFEQYSESNESVKSTTGFEMISWLDVAGITQESFQQLKETVNLINQRKIEYPEENESITGRVKQISSALITVLGYLFKPENTAVYQAYFSRDTTQRRSQQSQPSDSWLSKHSKKYTEQVWQYSVHLICLSPAIVFGELLSARSIILASGTLSPLETFQSELGVEFPHVVKGFHVVPRQNIFVSPIEFGPQKYALKGVFENTNKYEYQDELGRAILETCKVVPHGVLCFFPSYSLMDKLKYRWQSIGLIQEMEGYKEMFWEPRQKGEIDNVMMGFSERVDLSVDNPNEEIGAIMFGVFRGKIAEGIDFSDDYARAVIAVGIPFKNLYSKEINLKMKFNDRTTNTSKKVLTGNHWYRIQAYRALNQALGRCIRHRNDWGAVILMDSRMCSTDSQSNLPRWIQQEIQPFRCWEHYLRDLTSFCEKMKDKQNDTAAASEMT